MELPTVEIVNQDAKSGFTRINEADFDPKRHTLYKPQANSVAGESWPGAMESAGGNEQPPVVIPDDWRDLHHNRKINLAEQIIGGDIEPADGKTKTQLAEDIIAAKVEKRKAA